MECPKCNFENPNGAKFCMECGTKLENVCPKCGTKLPKEAKFCMECGAKVSELVTAVQPVVPPKLEDMQARLYIPEPLKQRMDTAEQEMEGENRLVTALFADISGFTPMSQKLTTEAVVEKVNQCFQAVTDVVYRYEGSINRFIGDCVLAFFGAPLTYENDPERAILAALDMREAVSKFELDISVGINSGMMYFGPIGTQRHLEISAYGTDINLAKRLQEAAQPGQILVGEGTYRFTLRAFDFEPLPPLTLRGIAEPVSAYALLKVLSKPEKIRGIEGLKAEMIGREKEFADLKECVDNLSAGKGQIVSIIGEAGVGKSRLVSELKAYLEKQEEWEGVGREERKDGRMEEQNSEFRIPNSEFLWLEGRCVSIGESIGYWVFIDILKSYLEFSGEESEKEIREKIVDEMKAIFPQRWEDIVPYIGNFLSVKFGNEWDEKVKSLPPEQLKYQTYLTLRDLFLALANQKPLLLIFEDLHWADNLSLELLSLLMDELTHAPLMLLCIYRPEKEHKSRHIGTQASGKCLDRYREITLRELKPQESQRLVESLLRIENLPEKIKESILRKAEGNPFFVEEVIRSLIHSGFVYRDGSRWMAKTDIEEIAVPDTIQSVIMVRIDGLEDEVRYVLQCASVIGRLFPHKLLQYTTQAVHEVIAERSEQEQNLDRYLWELQEKELVYEERAIPELEYSFKHVLIQETAYQNLLSRHRQVFHQKIGDGIEMLYQDRIEEFYEELAWHYSQSDNLPKVIDYSLKAGKKAKGMYANQEAIRYFERALEFLQSQPADEKQVSLEMTARELLGDVLFTTGAHHEAEIQLNHALNLASKQQDVRHTAALTCKLADMIHWQGELDRAIEMAESGLAALGEQRHNPEAASLLEVISRSYWAKEDWESTRRYVNQTAQIIRQIPYFDSIYKLYYSFAWLEIHARNFQAASDWLKELERICLAHNNEVGLARCYHGLGDLWRYQIDFRQASQWLEKSLSYCERTGDAHLLLEGHLELAYLLILLDEPPSQIKAHIQRGIEIADQMARTSQVSSAPGLYRMLGDAYWQLVQSSCLLP